MITKIKKFFKRLCLAYQIVTKKKCYYIEFVGDNIPDDRIYLSAAIAAAEEYLKLKTDDAASLVARWNIILHALITEESILAQYKERDKCCVSYDCNSEEDLDEFLNQEI